MLDVHLVHRHCDHGHRRDERGELQVAYAHYRRAAELYRGDLLIADVKEPWVAAQAAMLERRQRAALDRIAESSPGSRLAWRSLRARISPPASNAVRAFWLSARIPFASALALGVQTNVVARTGFLLGDFRAFYCAARVASHGADPYRTEPLRDVRIRRRRPGIFRRNRGVAVPAPLPGYAIAAVVTFAMLPFGVAASLWTALLLAAWIVAVAALARVASISWQIASAIFSLSLGVLSLPFGEIVPLALAFICLAAYFAREERWVGAALCGAGALVEPHLGLPVCIALMVWAPATRWTLVATAGVLGLISLAMLGPAVNLKYFATVLPAHALSEVSRDTQYSLSAILFALGVPGRAAILAGTASYVASFWWERFSPAGWRR